VIEPDNRKAVFALHTEGMTLREISRRLRISRNTVRAIIRQDGQQPDIVRKNQKQIGSVQRASHSRSISRTTANAIRRPRRLDCMRWVRR
jgi:DNA-binding CsgD family transcriptional regulator